MMTAIICITAALINLVFLYKWATRVRPTSRRFGIVLIRDTVLLELFILAFVWIITQGDTTDGGKLIRLFSYIATALIWLQYTILGRKVMKFICKPLKMDDDE